ncbi:hypothetical protein [Pendulispora albinea]|uniref:Uncharacterized protein n=1 Tax=Pendulispora albinea TaxID=2741071 RepID=A0ABZ2M773_9BACT
MTDARDGVRHPYDATGLTERLKVAFSPLEPGSPQLATNTRRTFMEGRIGIPSAALEAAGSSLERRLKCRR